jgi:hypothetical protein
MAITISGDTPNFSSATITTGTVTTLTAPTSTITTLNAPSGVLATQNGMTGIAKAWVQFNGNSGGSINQSFNVSSITRTATGQYTINFTNAMPNANYAISGTADGTGTYYCALVKSQTVTPTTSSFAVISATYNAVQDSAYMSIVVHGS